jgi:hypothetical protein
MAEDNGKKSLLERLIKFDPINITQIIIYGITIFVLFIFFKTELKSFMNSLQERPFTIKMEGSGVSINFEEPVKPDLIKTASYTLPDESARFNDWLENVTNLNQAEQFTKGGFGELFEGLRSIKQGEPAVINYIVNSAGWSYFNDKNMLKYLSIASERVRYLAFYNNSIFEGYIHIGRVIKGLASDEEKFVNFGDKLINGEWREFPDLIGKENAFTKVPSIKELYDRLTKENITEVPLLENNRLKSILNYKTVTMALYSQAQKAASENKIET